MAAPTAFYRRLGVRIREHRVGLGRTQQDLADELTLSRTSVVNIETGRQHLAVHQLARVADFLGCPPGDLIPSLEPGDTLSEAIRNQAPDERSLSFLSAISEDTGSE